MYKRSSLQKTSYIQRARIFEEEKTEETDALPTIGSGARMWEE